MGIRNQSRIQLLKKSGGIIPAIPITLVSNTVEVQQFKIGRPSRDVLQAGFKVFFVTGMGNAGRFEKRLLKRMETEVGPMPADRPDFDRVLKNIPASINGRSFMPLLDHVHRGVPLGTQYAFWLMDRNYDYDHDDFFDGVRFGITLGCGSSRVEEGTYTLRVHGPEGASEEELSQTLNIFEDWLNS